jgi:hypothetical protein
MNDLEAGAIFRAPYPFILDKYTAVENDGDGYSTSEQTTWKPGTRLETVYIPPDDCDSVNIADGVGEIILTIVSTHKPGHYPTRVFFVRQWRSPAGKEFGKRSCRCVTAEKFRRLAKGYAYPFEIDQKKTRAA